MPSIHARASTNPETTPLLASSCARPLRSKPHAGSTGRPMGPKHHNRSHPPSKALRPVSSSAATSSSTLYNASTSIDVGSMANEGVASWDQIGYVVDPKSPVVLSQPQPTPQSRPPYFSGVSLTLRNSGSVARDHLASERTYLAYMRTSLAIAASGVALIQVYSSSGGIEDSQRRVHLLQRYVRPLGATTILMGMLVLVVGIFRYFSVQSALTKGYFPAARLVTGLMSLVVATLVTITFAVVVSCRPTSLVADG